MMIDTHCHLYLKEYKNDLQEIIDRALIAGVMKFYLPCIDSSVIGDMLHLEESYKGMCFPMMGLHPGSVKEDYLQQLDTVEGWLQQRKFAAVGEIGLDFYWDRTFVKQQYICFERQIEWALHFKLPVVIHSRNATRECIDVVKRYQANGLTGVFHCFGGGYDLALEIIACGFYAGIGGVITYKNAGLAEVVAKIPLEHIVLETDAPYLSPVPFRGKRNESSYLSLVAEKVAQVKGVSVEEVVAITTANAEKLFAG